MSTIETPHDMPDVSSPPEIPASSVDLNALNHDMTSILDKPHVVLAPENVPASPNLGMYAPDTIMPPRPGESLLGQTQFAPDVPPATPHDLLERLKDYNATHTPVPPPPPLPDDMAHSLAHLENATPTVTPVISPEHILPIAENIPTPAPMPVSSNFFDLPYGNKVFHFDIADVADKKQILFEGTKIAESIPNPNGGNGTMMQLLDKYQDGSQYSPMREVYNQTFSKLSNFDFKPGRELTNIPFEKGGIRFFTESATTKTRWIFI